jgi:hypothetical protein
MVKNPQILSMEWEPEAIYQGQEVALILKTFEVAEFAPKATTQAWEHLKKNSEKMLDEQEVTLDTNNMEIHIKTPYDVKHLERYNEEKEYEIQAKVVSNSLPIKGCQCKSLIVGVYNVL